MAQHKILPLFLVSACTLLIVQSLPTLHHLSKRSSQRLCGRVLVQTLALVCDGQYYDPTGKRNYNFKSDFKNENPLYDMDSNKNSDSDEYMDRKAAISFFKRNEFFERVSRGVSDECCKKSCSMNELLSYCL